MAKQTKPVKKATKKTAKKSASYNKKEKTDPVPQVLSDTVSMCGNDCVNTSQPSIDDHSFKYGYDVGSRDGRDAGKREAEINNPYSKLLLLKRERASIEREILMFDNRVKDIDIEIESLEATIKGNLNKP